MIADRLRTLGDQYERQHGEHQLESWLSSLIFNQNPASTFSTGFTSISTTLQGLPQKVSEIFRIGYYLLKVLTADLGPNVNKLPREDMYRQWTLFERLWDIVMKTVSPWIWEHGEWVGQLLCYSCFLIDVVYISRSQSDLGSILVTMVTL